VTEIGLIGTAGKLPINDTVRSYLPASVLCHLNGITGPNGLYMIVTESIHKPGAHPANRSPDPASDEHDHLIWVLVSSLELHGDHPRAIFREGAALQALVLQLMAGCHPSLLRMVTETDSRVVSATALQASNLIDPWETTQVTLVGDAIHTMPPLRGLGGSTALKDAALLCSRLIEAERGQMPVLAAIREYEEAMIDYSYAAVRSTLQFADMQVNQRFDPSEITRLRQGRGAGGDAPARVGGARLE
jgi:FAD binding domain